MNSLRARLDIIFAFLLSILILMLYTRTLAPSLMSGDSAEFQTITYTLGIGHPTGYPVYVLLGKLFTFLPIGEIAYRINFLSSISAAIALAVIYLIIRQLGANRAAAVFGALLIAFVPYFWKFASIAEVYATSAACLAFILFSVLKWKETKNNFWIFLAGTLGGLSLGIHTSIALTAPAILLYLLADLTNQHERQQGMTTVKYALLGAVTGVCLFFFAFLYIDQRNSPVGYYNSVVLPSLSVWNMTATDFDSPLKRLAYLYFPPQFKGMFFAVPAAQVILRLKDFASDNWLLAAFGLLGIISYLLPSRKPAAEKNSTLLLLLTMLGISATFALTYNVYDYYSFYYPSFLTLGIFAALGIQRSAEAITNAVNVPQRVTLISWLVCGAMLLASFCRIVPDAWHNRIPPGLDEGDKYSYRSPGTNKYKAEKIISVLEDNAIVFTNWSKLYSFYYVAVVIHGKVDMDFHQAYPQEDDYQIADSVIQYIDANIDQRPIYFTMYPASLANRYLITPVGADLFRIEKK